MMRAPDFLAVLGVLLSACGDALPTDQDFARVLAAVLMPMFTAASVSASTAQRAGDTITVAPGDTLVNPLRIVPHRATWQVAQRDPNGGSIIQGFWSDTWLRSVEQGQPVLVFRQLFVDTAGGIVFENEVVLDARSLRTIRAAQSSPPSGGRAAYRFAGDTASGTFRPNAGAVDREFSIIFDRPAWEPSLPVSVTLPFERMQPGTVLRLPVWNQSGPGADVTWRDVRVDSTGRAFDSDGRAIDVWYLTVTLAATPATVTRLRQSPQPPFFWWFEISRPGQHREWTLLSWRSFMTAQHDQ